VWGVGWWVGGGGGCKEIDRRERQRESSVQISLLYYYTNHFLYVKCTMSLVEVISTEHYCGCLWLGGQFFDKICYLPYSYFKIPFSSKYLGTFILKVGSKQRTHLMLINKSHVVSLWYKVLWYIDKSYRWSDSLNMSGIRMILSNLQSN
jgi:hypothetical protein